MRPTLFSPGLLALCLLSFAPPAPRVPQDSGAGGLTLSDSAAVARVLDREGNVLRKGRGDERWSALEAHDSLLPGDWVKTGTRGANATKLRTTGGAEVILGPASLLEFDAAGALKLVQGEAEFTPAEDTPLAVDGPEGSRLTLEGTRSVRAADAGLETLAQSPAWLRGYRDSASTEALGSLLANVDGRDVPLTLGYHKVTVDVRDQIARTVVEESFLNHTDHVLEGVFYFPLPEDASVSGFAMWIGDQLVEGDIVEKQRAREIYETILREKRDPGLLEWTGGNLFKARVYPISGEKKIRLTYTQVLPKRDGVYRYHYSLQSDLLRLNPLAQLQIDVTVSSAQLLESVTSPTHECRVQKGEHAARVQFEAEEFVPDRDFELVVRPAAAPGGLTVVTHRRGEDGYFMALVDAPAAPEADAARAEPLDLLVMVDTSGSAAGAVRDAELRFLEALLDSLSEGDRFNVLTFDTEARFAFPGAVAPEAGTRRAALAFVEERFPLGWTDLDRAFEAAFSAARPGTQVVFVGDGIFTARDADPAALGRRLAQAQGGAGTFHCVVPGNQSDPTVLRAIAGLGSGGAVLAVGSRGTAAVATDLLQQMSGPALEGVVVRGDGVLTAALYPEKLPRVPAGTQQVLLGRYEPASLRPGASLRLEGRFAGEAFSATVEFRAEEDGNSFLPRLWARRSLDALLAEGSGASVQARALALSEDYQIITPWSSFLVLESEEDRRRFGVNPSFRMRDGEEFFAEGRDAALFELKREQMLLARAWRRELRADVLDMLDGLGRDATLLLAPPAFPLGGEFGELRALGYLSDEGIVDGRAAAGSGGRFANRLSAGRELAPVPEEEAQLGEDTLESDSADVFSGEEVLEDPQVPPASTPAARQESVAKKVAQDADFSLARGGGGGPVADSAGFHVGRGRRQDHYFPYGNPFAGLFPDVGGPRSRPEPRTEPEDVAALLRRLDRRPAVAALADAGMRITTSLEAKDSRGRETPPRTALHLLSAARWAAVSVHAAGERSSLHWCDDTVRGVLDDLWDLGQSRPTRDLDATSWYAPFPWYFGEDFSSFDTYQARIEQNGERATLFFRNPASPEYLVEVLVDLPRNAVVEVRWRKDDELTGLVSFGEFTEVSGTWWPGVMVQGVPGQQQSTTRIRVEALDVPVFAAAWDALLAARERAIVLGPLPDDQPAALQALKDGTATLEDAWFLLLDAAGRGQWEEAEPYLEGFARLAGDAFGLRAVKLRFLQQQRVGAEYLALLEDTVQHLVAVPRPAEFELAVQIARQWSTDLLAPNERRPLLEALAPVFPRAADTRERRFAYETLLVQSLDALGRNEEAFRRRAELAEEYRDHLAAHLDYANSLAQRGDVDLALTQILNAERQFGPWTEWEVQEMHRSMIQILWNARRVEDVVAWVESWELTGPATTGQNVLSRYLASLILSGADTKGWQKIREWILVEDDEPLEVRRAAQLGAAIAVAVGQGYESYSYPQRFQPDVTELLVEAARRLVDHPTAVHHASSILLQYGFRQTQEAQDLLRSLFARLQEECRAMPVARLAAWIGFLRWGYPEGITEESWKAVYEDLLERWMRDGAERPILGQLLLNSNFPEVQREYLRRAADAATDLREEAGLAHQLFQNLLGSPWEAPLEFEAYDLLVTRASRFSALDDPPLDLDTLIVDLYQLTNWAVAGRTEALLREQADFTALSRRELAAERARRETEALTAVLHSSEVFQLRLGTQPLAPWMELEVRYLKTRLRTDPEAVRSACERLLRQPPQDEREGAELRAQVMALRNAYTLVSLATLEPGAEPGAFEQSLRALFQELREAGDERIDWRRAEYLLLVAADRAHELLDALPVWYAEDRSESRIVWGRTLAHLLAELGKLEEAIRQLADAGSVNCLTAADWNAVADWHTALGDAEALRAAQRRSFAAMTEDELAQHLQRQQGRYVGHGDQPPDALGEDIPRALEVLFQRATLPQGHLWLLERYYQSTRDFRLLQCLPAGVLGHTPQGIYPFLAQARSLLSTVQEEATVDRLVQYLESLRTPERSELDRRALTLLEFTVESLAVHQTHGTRDHAEAAARALEASLRGAWQDGEPRLMAEFLAGCGALAPSALLERQLDVLAQLHAPAQPGSDDRLALAQALASVQWAGGRRTAAVRTGEATLEEMRTGGLLPVSTNDLVTTHAGCLEELGDFLGAETLWRGESEAPYPLERRLWFRLNLYRMYDTAFLRQGTLSLGEGKELYRRVLAQGLEELRVRTQETFAGELLSVLCTLIQHAAQAKVGSAGTDARNLAFTELPGVLALYHYRNGQQMVQQVAECVRVTAGPLAALEFLTVRAETEPRWLLYANQDFWSHHGWTYAHCRGLVGDVPEPLAERVLAVACRELRAYLVLGQARSDGMYHQQHGYFWKEKADDFADVARAVLAAHAGSEERVMRCGIYLFEGLGMQREATTALLAAYRRGLLHLDSQLILTDQLVKCGRHDEAIPVLTAFLEERPEEVRGWTNLMKAYAGRGRGDEAREALARAQEFFHEAERWNESVAAALAETCVETRLLVEATALYDEAVNLHTRERRDRGVGDGTLAHYYLRLAEAYQGLGDTAKAVDAAAGAILSWGRREDQRNAALQRLEAVLAASPDLDAYVASLDREVEETGLENPIVRKALGSVYAQRREWDRASDQLQKALAVRPEDLDTQRQAIQVWDDAKRPEQAIAQLLRFLDVNPRELSLYQDLGQRWLAQEQPENAERAFTSLVEARPGESESHAALAEIREEEERWSDAALHWQHVLEIRRNEPQGYLRLAAARLHLDDPAGAEELLAEVLARDWPAHFDDAKETASKLLERLHR